MQDVGDLALRAAFVDVMVPAADVGEGDLNSEIRFDQLRELLEAVAEVSAGIVGGRGGLVFRRIGRSQHLYRVESFLTGAVQHGIDRVLVHGFEAIGIRRGFGIVSAHAEVVDVIYRDCGLAAGKNSRQGWSEGDGAKSRVGRCGLR